MKKFNFAQWMVTIFGVLIAVLVALALVFDGDSQEKITAENIDIPVSETNYTDIDVIEPEEEKIEYAIEGSENLKMTNKNGKYTGSIQYKTNQDNIGTLGFSIDEDGEVRYDEYSLDNLPEGEQTNMDYYEYIILNLKETYQYHEKMHERIESNT